MKKVCVTEKRKNVLKKPEEKHFWSLYCVTKLTILVCGEGWNGTCKGYTTFEKKQAGRKTMQLCTKGNFKSDSYDLNLTLTVPQL